MTTLYAPGSKDSWYAYVNSTSKYGAGAGNRLMVGYAVQGSGDTWQNRFGVGYDCSALPASVSSVTSATIRLKVRGTLSCWSRGANPKFWVERVSDPAYILGENGTTGECSVGSGGDVDDERWGGPASTTTNRVKYEGTPATGDVIEVDVTDAFNDWLAARGGSDDWFCVKALAADASTGYDETNSGRRIAFTSWDAAGGSPINTGGSGSDLELVYTLNTTPSAPTVFSNPGARATGTTDRTFQADWTDADNDDLSSVHIIVATSNAVDGNGKLTTGIVHDSDSATFTMLSPLSIWSTTRTFAQTRGTTYYWQCAVTDNSGAGNAKSGWSAVQSYVVNRLPVPTKVRPT